MAKAESIAILTFNYDVALDYGPISNGIQIDYGLQESYQPQSMPLLKLHGSLNFGRCKQCGVVAWPLNDYLVEKSRGIMPRPEYAGGGKLRFTVGSEIGHFRHCNHPEPCDSEPIVVPPTWSKGRHYPNIERVWKHAATELSEAENVVLIGYSWPNSDEFFHHLYALGTAGPTLLQKVLVIDINPAVGERYRDALFGEQARQRFEQLNITFENSMREVLLRLIQPAKVVRF
jgi:NAD-dependent SIR2 family protein deacetylase